MSGAEDGDDAAATSIDDVDVSIALSLGAMKLTSSSSSSGSESDDALIFHRGSNSDSSSHSRGSSGEGNNNTDEVDVDEWDAQAKQLSEHFMGKGGDGAADEEGGGEGGDDFELNMNHLSLHNSKAEIHLLNSNDADDDDGGDAGGLIFSGGEAGGSIWSQGGGLFDEQSAIADLLEREGGYVLEELLAEDELLQEVKSMNAKLIQVLTEKDNLGTLVEYAVWGKRRTSECPLQLDSGKQRADLVNPVDEDNNDDDDDIPSAAELSARFSYMATEVICCDVRAIMSAMMASVDHIAELFSILTDVSADAKKEAAAKGEELPRAMQLGYVLKILTALVKRSGEKVIVFASRYEGGKVLDALVRNLDSYTVACIFKLLIHVSLVTREGGAATGKGDNENETGSFIEDDAADDDVVPGGIKRFGSVVEISSEDGGGEEAAPELDYSPEELAFAQDLWLGGRGLAQTLVKVMRDESGHRDAHAHAAELLVDLLHVYAMSTAPSEWPKSDGEAGINDDDDDSSSWVCSVSASLASLAESEPSERYIAPTEALKALSDIVGAFSPAEWRARPRRLASVQFVDIASAAEAMLALGKDDEKSEPEPHEVPGPISAILKRLDGIKVALLPDAEPRRTYRTTWGGFIEPLGERRLAAVHLVSALIHSRIRTVIDAASGCCDDADAESCVSMCLDLFFRFPFNSLLHNTVARIVLLILGMCDAEAQQSTTLAMGGGMDGMGFAAGSGFGDNEMNDYGDGPRGSNGAPTEAAYHPTTRVLFGAQGMLFDKCDLVGRLLKFGEPDPEFESMYSTCKHPPKKASAGHVIEMANALVAAASAQADAKEGPLNDYLDGNDAWKAFVEGELKKSNDIQAEGWEPNRSALSGGDSPNFSFELAPMDNEGEDGVAVEDVLYVDDLDDEDGSHSSDEDDEDGNDLIARYGIGSSVSEEESWKPDFSDAFGGSSAEDNVVIDDGGEAWKPDFSAAFDDEE